jgi:hypothetical protein
MVTLYVLPNAFELSVCGYEIFGFRYFILNLVCNNFMF